MVATLNFLTLAVTTIFATGAAVLADFLLLQGALRLMRLLEPIAPAPRVNEAVLITRFIFTRYLDHRKKGVTPCWL